MIAHHQRSAIFPKLNKLPGQALELVDNTIHQRTTLTRDAIYHLLQECIKRKDLAAGRHAYCFMVTLGLDSITVLVDHLVRLFAECGCMLEADDIFSKASRRSIFTWNAIISAHANSGEHGKALTLFYQMQKKEVQPDRITFLMVFKACRSMGNLGQVQLLHSLVNQHELDSDVIVGSTLIDVYAKGGAVEEARRVFDRLRNRNIVSWGAMIAGYVQHGHFLPALLLYKQMELEGIEPNRVVFLCLLKSCSGITALREGRMIHDQILRKSCQSDIEIGNALVDMYAKCGSLAEGNKVFVKLLARTVISWGTMIAGYTRHGHCDEAVLCFEAMRKQGVKPDHVIFTSILAACSHEGLLDEGHRYFKSMINDYNIAPKMEHYSCMIDLLGRVGRLNEALSFLHSMPMLSDSVLLTSLLTSCKTYHNVELGRFIFDILADLDPTNASLYVLMSNIYADAQMWEAVYHLQELMRAAGAWRKAGMAWIEVGDMVHEFTVGSKGCCSSEKHAKLQLLSRFSIQKGHVPLLDLVWEPLTVSDALV